MSLINSPFYSGTSGVALPVAKALYPDPFKDKSGLNYYASLFNSVEINSSFYKNPRNSTVSKWADSVPENFRFTFKLSKAITHAKGLEFDVEDIHQFMEMTAFIGNKKGCLLAQFPPSLKIEKFNKLKNLLESLKVANPENLWKVAVEFRNASWYEQEVYSLLSEHNTSIVIHDIPASATPNTEATAEFSYLRFHGTENLYRGSYSNEFLYRYAQDAKAWAKDGKEVYIYFNNTMGDAVKNLQTLNQYLQENA